MYVRWSWIVAACGALALGVALFLLQSTYSCASGGAAMCGPTLVDRAGTALIVLASSAAVLYSLARAFRDPRSR